MATVPNYLLPHLANIIMMDASIIIIVKPLATDPQPEACQRLWRPREGAIRKCKSALCLGPDQSHDEYGYNYR